MTLIDRVLVRVHETLPPAHTDGMILRAYVATQWMTVTDVLGYFDKDEPYSFPRRRRYARVLVDNNGGEPFETDIELTSGGFSRLVPGSSCCDPCNDGEHADDGTGQNCPCCGVFVPAAPFA